MTAPPPAALLPTVTRSAAATIAASTTTYGANADRAWSQGINASRPSIEFDRLGGLVWNGSRSGRTKKIARLSAMGLPSRLISQQIGRHHRTVWGRTKQLR